MSDWLYWTMFGLTALGWGTALTAIYWPLPKTEVGGE